MVRFGVTFFAGEAAAARASSQRLAWYFKGRRITEDAQTLLEAIADDGDDDAATADAVAADAPKARR
ncbi:MAG: hypothetical protein ACOY9J_10465 [Pseudomonadota bacterium]